MGDIEDIPKSYPKTPKKRAPVKRESSVHPEWSKLPSRLSHIPPDLEKLQQHVDLLQKRVNSLEQEWVQLLEHLSQQEGSTECITDEDEMN